MVHRQRVGENTEAILELEAEGGLSLRDWFAGQASEEDIRANTGSKEDSFGYRMPLRTREEARYHYADTMLKAREKPSR